MKMLRNRIHATSLPNTLSPVIAFLEKDKPLTAPQMGILTGLLIIIMLAPIWIGKYAPLYDYPNHLLEAQIVAHYSDPQLNYGESYRITPGWYWQSNALSTVLLVGLARIMPVTLAGHLVLSLYVVLFTCGLAWLLYRS